jgi:hypothetical protein
MLHLLVLLVKLVVVYFFNYYLVMHYACVHEGLACTKNYKRSHNDNLLIATMFF